MGMRPIEDPHWGKGMGMRLIVGPHRGKGMGMRLRTMPPDCACGCGTMILSLVLSELILYGGMQ